MKSGINKKQDLQGDNRIAVLDDLRGIAILLVVFYHYFFVYYRHAEIETEFVFWFRIFNDYFNLGIFGVSLFFLISGFVIPMSLNLGDTSKLKAVKQFAVKRFFRLFPPYWIAIILISCIFAFKEPYPYTAITILANATMLQDLFHVESIDGVFWTLMIELKFYVLMSIAFYFGFFKKIERIFLFFFVLSVVSMVLSYQDGSRSFGNSLWQYLMLMGTIFYKNYNGSISKNVYFLCLVLTVGYFGINHYFVISSSFGESLGLSLATLSALILFKISINYKNNISEFTMFYGEISYSLYLLHQMIGYYLINLIGENLFPSPWSQVFIFSLMTFVAFWVNRLIEVPTNAFGKKLAKHIQ